MQAHALTTALLLTAAFSTAGSTAPSFGLAAAERAPAMTPTKPPPDPTTPVAGEYGSDEVFCAKAPARGRIRYDVTGRDVTLDLHVDGLPPRADLGVGWHNAHTPRGYTIASFRTDAHGKARQGSLRMFRPGEARGSAMVLTSRGDHVADRLRPCRHHRQ